MVLFSDDTTCFPNLFLEELLYPPRLAEEARMLADPDPPDTLMIAFANEPVAMPTLVLIITNALPPARATTRERTFSTG